MTSAQRWIHSILGPKMTLVLPNVFADTENLFFDYSNSYGSGRLHQVHTECAPDAPRSRTGESEAHPVCRAQDPRQPPWRQAGGFHEGLL
jgi:hypothetical protein